MDIDHDRGGDDHSLTPVSPDWPDQLAGFAENPIECPWCGQTTLANVLSDDSLVCSCSAQRALPLGSEDGRPVLLPAPVDDTTFGSNRHSTDLPKDEGQFGADVATEAYRTLGDMAAPD